MAINVPIITTFDSKGITKAIRDFKKLETASDKAGYGLQSIDAGAKKFAAAFTKVAAVGGLVVGVIGKSLVNAALESQKAMKQTEAIILATGGAANVTSQYVAKLSDKLSKQTGVDDELIQTSANLLLTFKQVQNVTGKGNQIFDRAVTAALDLGNVFGSTDAAAKQLGKALSDPEKGITALKKAGINFTEAQKDQIKAFIDTGKVLDAQKLILKEVESQVGGTAAATATDFDRMKVAVENVGESLGALLLPALESISRFVINNVTPVFETFAVIVGKQGVGAGVNYLVGSLINAITKMGTLGKVVGVLTASFVALRVATITYTAVVTALKLISEVATGSLLVMVTALNATKIAMLAAGGVVALLVVAASLYGVYASQKAKATQATQNFSDALYTEGEAQRNAIAELATSDPVFGKLLSLMTALGYSVDDLSTFLTTGKGPLENFQVILMAAAGASGTLKDNQNLLGKSFVDAATKVGISGQALDDVYYKLENLNKQGYASRATLETLKQFGVEPPKNLNNLGNGLDKAKEKLATFTSALKGYGTEQKQLSSATKGIETANRSLASAIKATADANYNLTQAQKATTDAYAKLTTAQNATKEANLKLTAAQTSTAKAQQHLTQVTNGYGASSKQAASAQGVFAQAQRDGVRAGIALADAQQAVVDAQLKLSDLQTAADPRTIQEGQDAVTEATYRVSDAEAALAEAQKGGKAKDIALAEIDLRNARYGLTDATNALTASQAAADPQALIDAQEVLTQAELDLTEKQIAQKDATDAITTAQTLLNEAINGAPAGTQAYTDALDLLNQAKLDEKTATDNVSAALQAETDASDGIAEALRNEVGARDAISAAALAEADARDAITEAVELERMAKLELAQAERDLKAAQTGITAKQVATAVKQTGVKMPKAKKGKKGKAVGGSVYAGNPYIVGERGRELFVPTTTGNIVPNDKMGGGDVFNININSKIADDSLPDLIVAELRKFNRRSGAINIQVA
jgi:hypothetical protein